MAIEDKKNEAEKEQKEEEDIRDAKIKPKDSKKRIALGMAKKGRGHLPTKDSLNV